MRLTSARKRLIESKITPAVIESIAISIMPVERTAVGTNDTPGFSKYAK